MTVLAVAGSTFTFGISLEDQANAGLFKAGPTIAAGDFQRSINGGAFANLDNLPTVTPAAGVRVQIVLSAAETTSAADGGTIYVRGVDASGDEWYDTAIEVRVAGADVATRTNITAGTITTVTNVSSANVTLWAGDAVGDAPATAAGVWAYGTRTLTEGSTTTTDATAAGSITRKRGNSWSISMTIGAITGYTSLWFTIKRSYDDPDSAAILQIKLNATTTDDDLLTVNGAAATSAALGTITVSDASTGAIVVAVDETITDDLPVGVFYYDAQALISGNVTTPEAGTFTISADVTRAVA